jgi:hypothetical protein
MKSVFVPVLLSVLALTITRTSQADSCAAERRTLNQEIKRRYKEYGKARIASERQERQARAALNRNGRRQLGILNTMLENHERYSRANVRHMDELKLKSGADLTVSEAREELKKLDGIENLPVVSLPLILEDTLVSASPSVGDMKVREAFKESAPFRAAEYLAKVRGDYYRRAQDIMARNLSSQRFECDSTHPATQIPDVHSLAGE